MYGQIPAQTFDVLFDNMLFIMRLLYIFGCDYCITIFYCYIIGNTLKKRSYKFVLPVIYGIALCTAYLIPIEMPAILAYSAAVASAFAASCFIYNASWTIKLYIAVTFLAIQYIVFAIFTYWAIASINLRDVICAHVPAGTVSFLVSFIIVELLIKAGEILLTYAAVKIISRQFKNIPAKLSKIEFAYLITPSVALLLNLWLLGTEQFYVDDEAIGAAVVAAGTISLICVILVAVIYKKLNEAKQSEQAGMLLVQQIAEFKKQFKSQSDRQTRQASALHEYRNRLQTIKILAQNNEYEELQNYIDDVANELNSITGKIPKITGNSVIDGVLRAKSQEAANVGKELDISLEQIPEEIKPYDISVILANTIDNAIEASSNDKDDIIEVRGMARASSYIIAVKNSYSGNVIRDGKRFVSTKAVERGFGILNIEAAAKKYNGYVNINENDGKFVIVIVLKLN